LNPKSDVSVVSRFLLKVLLEQLERSLQAVARHFVPSTATPREVRPDNLTADWRSVDDALSVRISTVEQVLPSLKRLFVSAVKLVQIGTTAFFIFACLFAYSPLTNSQ